MKHTETETERERDVAGREKRDSFEFDLLCAGFCLTKGLLAKQFIPFLFLSCPFLRASLDLKVSVSLNMAILSNKRAMFQTGLHVCSKSVLLGH